jgi:UPF0716 family protein affecting phage T7 exclusion
MIHLLLGLILMIPFASYSQEKQTSPQVTEKEQKQEEKPQAENKSKTIDLNAGPYKNGEYQYYDRQRIEAQGSRDNESGM